MILCGKKISQNYSFNFFWKLSIFYNTDKWSGIFYCERDSRRKIEKREVEDKSKDLCLFIISMKMNDALHISHFALEYLL